MRQELRAKMLKRITSIITVIALTNSLLACTSTIYLTPAQFERETQKKERPHKIVAVVPSADSVRQFDNDGGEYDSCRDAILGRDQGGQPIEVPATDCRLRVETQHQGNPKLSVVKTKSYLKKYATRTQQKISRAFLDSGDTLNFYLGDGRLNANRKSICGLAENGQYYNRDLADVTLLEIKKENETGGLLLVLGLVGFVALVYALDKWKIDMDLGEWE
jgi:hypothetical protein